MRLSFTLPSVSITVESLNVHLPSGAVEAKLDTIIANQEIIMSTVAEFEAAFARIDTATNQIAAILRDIGTQIGSMTAEQEDAARTRLEGVATALEALAASGPTNPVPVPVPTP